MEWSRNTESDFSHYDVAASAATFTVAQATALIIGNTRTNSVTLTEIPAGQTRFVRVRAVDTSGNASAWTATIVSRAVVTPPVINAQGLIDATSFAAGLEPLTIVTTAVFPIAKLTTTIVWNGRLYRWNGTGYVPSVPQVDPSNIYPDFDLLDNGFYSSSTGHVITFGAIANAVMGARNANLGGAAEGVPRAAETGWFSLDTRSPLRATGSVSLVSASSGTTRLELELGTLATTGAITATPASVLLRCSWAFSRVTYRYL